MNEGPGRAAQIRVRFLADENLDYVIVQGLRLRQPQVDILTAPQAGILGFADPEVLAYAAQHDRILISHDKRTMPDYSAAFLVAGNQSPGVMLVSRKVAIGQAIEALLLIW
jgi:predicted nuclease of predicted toxin-antitoxin system